MSRPRSRSRQEDVHGVLLLDKPAGITSNIALQTAKSLLNAKKAGHTGSLDPLATGLLPLCFGDATKLSSYLLEADKHYTTVARLGIITDTADAEGEVIGRATVPVLDQHKIESVLAKFRGPIRQVPPMYSAVKVNGKRLHKLARKGLEIEREARDVVISSLHLTAFDASSLALDVSCSKGTYIRSLVEDIGNALGCGAHVEVLRRTGVEPFTVPAMCSLEQLEAMSPDERIASLLSTDTAVAHWSSITLDEQQSWLHRRGQIFSWDEPDCSPLRVYDDQGRFLSIGLIRDGKLRVARQILSEGL